MQPEDPPQQQHHHPAARRSSSTHSGIVVVHDEMPQAERAAGRRRDVHVVRHSRIVPASPPPQPYDAQVLDHSGRLGIVLKYRVNSSDSLDLYQNDPVKTEPAAGEVVFSNDVEGTVLKSTQTFRTDGRVLDWTIDVANRTQEPIEIGDFALSLPWRAPGGEDPDAIFERSWTKHQFISGAGSFFFYTRASGAPPYLMVMPLPGTKLQYFRWGEGRGGGTVFVHSARSGSAVTEGSWRQEHTALTLGPGRI